MPLELQFNSHGNDKQKLAYRYWSDSETDEIAYGGAKYCFAPDTLVRTTSGLVEISKIKIGDKVLSFNEDSRTGEYKRVLKVYRKHPKYWGSYNKMITFVMSDGGRISLTCNHEVYVNSTVEQRFYRRIICRDSWLREELFHFKHEMSDSF